MFGGCPSVRRVSSARRMSSFLEGCPDSEFFPMVGVCPRVSEDVQRILNVKTNILF